MTTHLRRLAAAALVLFLAVLALTPSPAHAASDAVDNLSVTFDVQPDGSVDVRHVLEWDFGEKGRRGIEFGIATREPWDQDRTQDVVYEVGDIAVSSPSGAPSTFTQSDQGGGSYEQIMLRIGDPNQALDTRRATYEITYTLRGALRTFDGVPELHWDVTSDDYPQVENFTVTVTGPDGVDAARCLAGSVKCQQAVTGGVATLSGTDVADGDTITAVAALPPGSIDDAEPILEPRRLVNPELAQQDSNFTVGTDGITSVRHTLTFALPEDSDEEDFRFRLDTRSPLSTQEDRLWPVTDVHATNELGDPLDLELDIPIQNESDEALTIKVTAPVSADTATIVLTYDVAGAVDSTGALAEFRLPINVTQASGMAETTSVWQFPGDVSSAECVRLGLEGEDKHRGCAEDEELSVDGSTVTLHSPTGRSSTGLVRLEARFPADSVGGATAIVEPSRDLAQKVTLAGSIGAGAGGLIAMIAAGIVLHRISRNTRDQRYVNVAPGLTDPGGRVATSRKRPAVAVQFERPDVDVATAGLLLDRTFAGRHTAAILTQLAVDDVVKLESSPLRIDVLDEEGGTSTLEQTLVTRLEGRSRTDELSVILRALNKVVNSHQLTAARDLRHFQPATSATNAWRGVCILVLGAVVPVIAIILTVVLDNWIARVGCIGLAVGGFIAAVVVSTAKPKRSLAADGSALLDQIRGFRLYIETAEAGQLDVEADQDIYRRNLPWAVLFGLTDRWTKVCRELAAAGLIAPLDTSFAGGLPAQQLVGNLRTLESTASLASLQDATRSSSSAGGGGWSSSGGSGGSSGFSSSGGGSGGGGTSAGSW